MGPRNSKESQLAILKDYQIIQQNPAENISFLQHRTTQEEYLLKQFNFNDKKQCQKTMERLAELKTKLAGNKHVVPLKDYLMNSEDQYCSTFYKIYALFQYPQRTLDDEINERKLHRKRFTETELWSILASCIVGLSHLQKNGIKHSSLKSKNILLSREGIIKVSDPSAIGQPSNYDAALTKRGTEHIYLSPEQTQALQQESVSPVFNSFKSDIWTLGMIMIEAGLLEYQDEECYRDDKSRIHWETVQYNIDRLGQAYSDEIKNMVEFMLSRDERARPDWIDLEEHVMKGSDDVRRSFIQEETKVDKTFSNSQSFNGHQNPNSNPIVLNPNRGRNTSQPFYPASSINTPALNPPAHLDSAVSQLNPRAPSLPVQMSSHQSSLLGANTTFGKYPRPESPRVSQQSSLYSQPLPAHTQLGNFNQVSNVQMINSSARPPVYTGLSPSFASPAVIGPPTVYSSYYPPMTQSTTPNISPLRPSNIEQTRPTKNIFPSDTYNIKTKFDENLIIMTQDDYQSEENQQSMKQNNGRIDFYASNSPGQQVQIKSTYPSSMPVNYVSQGLVYSTNEPRRLQEEQNLQNRTTKPFSEYSQSAYNRQQFAQQPQRPSTFGSGNMGLTGNPNSNGEPKFVTEEFRMGSRYEGYKVNGLRDGYGKFYYQDGGMYDGEWRENKMEGFGKLFYQSGKLAYEGQWKNDQFTGKGTLYNELPDALDRPFNYNNFDDVEEFWTKYEGQFADDMKNGKGVLHLSNGERLEGNFLADSVEGPGVYYCQNGTRVTGNWVGNRKVA